MYLSEGGDSVLRLLFGTRFLVVVVRDLRGVSFVRGVFGFTFV